MADKGIQRTSYNQTLGRITLSVGSEGYQQHDYGYGARISIPTGWNDSCQVITHNVSVEELRNLRYLIDRALAEDFR